MLRYFSFRLTPLTIALIATLVVAANAQVHIRTKIQQYVPPRPPFLGLHVGMSQDSALMLMSRIARRRDTLNAGEVTLIESDSVRVFGQPAYLQLQLTNRRIRTIVINFHPLGGGAYTALRDMLDDYMERYLGRGIAFKDESLTYHRWETEDGTSEVSHSDSYFRIFVRLGKPRT